MDLKNVTPMTQINEIERIKLKLKNVVTMTKINVTRETRKQKNRT